MHLKILRHRLSVDVGGENSASIWLPEFVLYQRVLLPATNPESTGPTLDLKGAFSSILEDPVIL